MDRGANMDLGNFAVISNFKARQHVWIYCEDYWQKSSNAEPTVSNPQIAVEAWALFDVLQTFFDVS